MKKLNLKWVSDTIGDDYKKWKPGDTVLVEAQTGTGKTTFIKNVLLNNMKSYERLLFVCNRTNLKRQLKKDLLVKFGEPIPEKLNDLDNVTTINNQITITSYHAISSTIKDELYDGNSTCDFSLYDYIVFDECHFIFADGSFNNKTRFAYEKSVHEYHPHTIRIFISATMDEIRDPIIRCNEMVKESRFGLDEPDIFEYCTGNDYSYVNPKYFKKFDTIINLIKNDKSNDKWLVFISDIERDGKKMIDELGEEKCSLIKSGTESDELNSIINNSRFTKKVLICTKAMDNGINLDDSKLKNIVIMAWDRISFIQMLGRKRVDIDNPQQVNLFIPTRFKNSFRSKLKKYKHKEAEIELFDKNTNEFYKKYDNDLKDFHNMNDIFYRDVKTGDIKLNHVGHKRLLEDIKFSEYMIDKFDSEGEYAFIHEQLSWLGLSDSNPDVNMLEDVMVDDEIDSLEEYLKTLEDKKLFKREQNELKQFITSDFDSMISKLQGRNKRVPGLKILNKLIVMCDIPYIIKSCKESKRIDGKVKSVNFWIVENL